MPDRVKHRYTVLKNPSFSPMGVVLRIIPAARRFIPITCITLIYYHLHLEEVTLHLYLVPNDCTIQKVILRTPRLGPGWVDRKSKMKLLSHLDRVLNGK